MTTNALRVCIISREFPPDTGWGGIATFAKHLAYGLLENGHQVEVVTLAKGEARSFQQDGLTIHRVKPYLRDEDLGLLARAIPYSRYVISTASALFDKFIERHKILPFDVVDTPELLAEGFYPALSKIAPLLIRLYTPHSKFIAERFHNVQPSFDHQFVAMVERIAMLHADVITSPSQDLAEFVSHDLNYPLETIKLVANPIDASVFCPQGDLAIDSNNHRKILFVGRLEERKGIRYLVEAIPEVVRTVPDAHFYVIGDDTNTGEGQSSIKAQLKTMLARERCESSVTFIERIPLTALPAYYRSADICVVPSLYDNSPYTCLEAMACGRAVIGTSAGGTKEYLVDGQSGILVEPKDAQSLAYELIRLLKHPEERVRLGENARARVLSHFKRSEIAKQTAELYLTAIERFKTSPKAPLYSSVPDHFLEDMEQMTMSFNGMLHELLYAWSYRYRIANLIHRLKTRPKLSMAQAILKSIRSLTPNFLKSKVDRLWPIQWLEAQIAEKERVVLTVGRFKNQMHLLSR